MQERRIDTCTAHVLLGICQHAVDLTWVYACTPAINVAKFDNIALHTNLIWRKRGRVLQGEKTAAGSFGLWPSVWQTTLLCLQARQFPDANLPGVPPEQTKAIFEAAIRTLVQLQSVDTDKLDLDGIGDKENFFHQKVSTQQIRLRAISLNTRSLDNVIQMFLLA